MIQGLSFAPGMAMHSGAQGTLPVSSIDAVQHMRAQRMAHGQARVFETAIQVLLHTDGLLSIGAAFAPLLSLLPDVDPQAGALLGMGAYLAGVTRSPLTASVIVLELTHSPDLAIPMLAATLMAAAISGWVSPVSLYHALAKQITDKLHAAASSSTEPAARQTSATEKP